MSIDQRNAAAVGGSCCLIIGLLLAIWQPVAFVIYLSLFLAAFILAIVAIAQKRVPAGLVLLILSIILPIGAVSYGVTQRWKTITQITGADSPPSASTSADNRPGVTPKPVWHYAAESDPMGRGMQRAAWITSENAIDLPFPYSGTQTVRLVIVHSPKYGLRVHVDLLRGQFQCTGGCTVPVRFDDQAIVQMDASPAADGDPKMLFIRSEETFIGKMMRAHTVRIEAPFWQAGSQVLTFPVAQFEAVKVLADGK